MSKRGRRLVALMTAALAPTVAWADVMDKEPRLGALWMLTLVLGVAGILAWLRSRVVGVLVSMIALPVVWSFHWELADPFVGRAIRLEAGASYVTQAYVCMVLCTAMHVAGMFGHGLKSRRLRR